jgi:hypothetical protein
LGSGAALLPDVDRPKVALGFLTASGTDEVTTSVCAEDRNGSGGMSGGNVVASPGDVNGTFGALERVSSMNGGCICSMCVAKREWFVDSGTPIGSVWTVMVLISFTENAQTCRPRPEAKQPTHHIVMLYAITDSVYEHQM